MSQPLYRIEDLPTIPGLSPPRPGSGLGSGFGSGGPPVPTPTWRDDLPFSTINVYIRGHLEPTSVLVDLPVEWEVSLADLGGRHGQYNNRVVYRGDPMQYQTAFNAITLHFGRLTTQRAIEYYGVSNDDTIPPIRTRLDVLPAEQNQIYAFIRRDGVGPEVNFPVLPAGWNQIDILQGFGSRHGYTVRILFRGPNDSFGEAYNRIRDYYNDLARDRRIITYGLSVTMAEPNPEVAHRTTAQTPTQQLAQAPTQQPAQGPAQGPGEVVFLPTYGETRMTEPQQSIYLFVRRDGGGPEVVMTRADLPTLPAGWIQSEIYYAPVTRHRYTARIHFQGPNDSFGDAYNQIRDFYNARARDHRHRIITYGLSLTTNEPEPDFAPAIPTPTPLPLRVQPPPSQRVQAQPLQITPEGRRILTGAASTVQTLLSETEETESTRQSIYLFIRRDPKIDRETTRPILPDGWIQGEGYTPLSRRGYTTRIQFQGPNDSFWEAYNQIRDFYNTQARDGRIIAYGLSLTTNEPEPDFVHRTRRTEQITPFPLRVQPPPSQRIQPPVDRPESGVAGPIIFIGRTQSTYVFIRRAGGGPEVNFPTLPPGWTHSEVLGTPVTQHWSTARIQFQGPASSSTEAQNQIREYYNDLLRNRTIAAYGVSWSGTEPRPVLIQDLPPTIGEIPNPSRIPSMRTTDPNPVPSQFRDSPTPFPLQVQPTQGRVQAQPQVSRRTTTTYPPPGSPPASVYVFVNRDIRLFLTVPRDLPKTWGFIEEQLITGSRHGYRLRILFQGNAADRIPATEAIVRFYDQYTQSGAIDFYGVSPTPTEPLPTPAFPSTLPTTLQQTPTTLQQTPTTLQQIPPTLQQTSDMASVYVFIDQFDHPLRDYPPGLPTTWRMGRGQPIVNSSRGYQLRILYQGPVDDRIRAVEAIHQLYDQYTQNGIIDFYGISDTTEEPPIHYLRGPQAPTLPGSTLPTTLQQAPTLPGSTFPSLQQPLASVYVFVDQDISFFRMFPLDLPTTWNLTRHDPVVGSPRGYRLRILFQGPAGNQIEAIETIVRMYDQLPQRGAINFYGLSTNGEEPLATYRPSDTRQEIRDARRSGQILPFPLRDQPPPSRVQAQPLPTDTRQQMLDARQGFDTVTELNQSMNRLHELLRANVRGKRGDYPGRSISDRPISQVPWPISPSTSQVPRPTSPPTSQVPLPRPTSPSTSQVPLPRPSASQVPLPRPSSPSRVSAAIPLSALPRPSAIPLPSQVSLPRPSTSQIPLPRPSTSQIPLPRPAAIPLPSQVTLPRPSTSQVPLPRPSAIPSQIPSQTWSEITVPYYGELSNLRPTITPRIDYSGTDSDTDDEDDYN